MEIVIVGGGKVGCALAEVFCDEHNVTVIDSNEVRINSIVNDYDVKGIVGNCLQTEVLDDADVSKCNIFIAVTISSRALSRRR